MKDNKPTVTTAVKATEEIRYKAVSHQIVFLKELLEKEALVKGYLRNNEVLFFKEIVNNLERLKMLKELDL